jgi:rare lipoprotein A
MREMPIFRAMRFEMRRWALLFVIALLAAFTGPAFAGQEGLASWYGGKFQGRTTSSGEVFDTNLMTAAHKSLPFGTVVKVTDLDTGSSTVVRINDRGPFVEGRIIDLSRAAADQLGMVGRGVARVSVEVVDFAAARPLFAVQVGSFGLEKNAEKARQLLEQAGFVATMEKTSVGVTRVLARGLAEKDLPGAQKRLEELGFARVLVRQEKAGQEL